MAKIEFQGEKYDDNDYPWFKLTFLENGFHVEMNKFKKLNPRLIARGMREVSRHRRILIKDLVRKERQNAGRQKDRRGSEESRGEATEGTREEDDELRELSERFIREHEEVHDGTGGAGKQDRKPAKKRRQVKVKA